MQLPTPTPFEFNFLRQRNHGAGHLWQPMMPAELGRQREPHA
jgi:hypothetical protein